MIYTLTLNPALDHIIRLDNIKIGETNRMRQEDIVAGGKGINVIKVLKNLKKDTVALGFVAGFSGKELTRLLVEDGIKTDFICVDKGFTRINVKLKARCETEINGPGLEISEKDTRKLMEKIDKINTGDSLFLSGSIPSVLGDDFYEKIMKHLDTRDVKIVVDTAGKALLNTLSYKPYLIKPNHRELEEIFSVKIRDLKDVKTYAKKLLSLGARHIIISLGGDGAFYISEDEESFYFKAPQGKVVDTVGSGDSMLAAFVYAMEEGFSQMEAFKYSICAGSATAFSKNLATKEEIDNLYKNL